jgi:TRAP-type C4-dicarboxylate transport system permease small subunit
MAHEPVAPAPRYTLQRSTAKRFIRISTSFLLWVLYRFFGLLFICLTTLSCIQDLSVPVSAQADQPHISMFTVFLAVFTLGVGLAVRHLRLCFFKELMDPR